MRFHFVKIEAFDVCFSGSNKNISLGVIDSGAPRARVGGAP